MNWYKTADSHEDTLGGQLLNQTRERLSKEVKGLKESVIAGGPKVARRFYGELRQRIIKLPPVERIPRLSMSELEELSAVVEGIQSDVAKYRPDGMRIASPRFETLKKNKKKLSDEERDKVMSSDAVWHPGNMDGPVPAVWKSEVGGKTWFVTNTHRAFQARKTLDGAISAFHDFIKSTAGKVGPEDS